MKTKKSYSGILARHVTNADIHLQGKSLWTAFGTGKSFRYISAHLIAHNIGIDKSRTLLMFHSLTGCDTVSSFAGREKKTFLEVWHAYPELTTALQRLSSTPLEFSMDIFDTIQRFIVLLYFRTSELGSVNEARKQLFCRGSRTLKNIPSI